MPACRGVVGGTRGGFSAKQGGFSVGLAIDTVGFFRTSGAGADASLLGATVAPGDSFTVRSFAQTSTASLEAVLYDATTAGGAVRVRSPMLHDNVRGLQWTPGESPSAFLLPAAAEQLLQRQDTLTVEMLVNAATETDVGALVIYYPDLTGASARLHAWGDISGIVAQMKVLEVDANTSATAGNWADTGITATENLLEANTDYAVLGYLVNTAVCAVAVKGGETNSLRVGGPGSIREEVTSDYFLRMANTKQTPHIPVFNSSNKDSIYVSLLAHQVSTAVKVQLILAELAHNIG